MQKISDLFNLEYGHSLELNRLEQSNEPGAVNFVGRAARNNGVTARVRPISDLSPAPPGTVTVALSGQGGAGVAFLQPFPYYCGFHVMILTPKYEMTEQEILWWVTCINANRFRFGFGRQANRSLRELMLPSRDEIPEWASEYAIPNYNNVTKPLAEPPCGIPSLDIKNWKSFRYDEIFEIERGQSLYLKNLHKGEFPYVSASANNNGITSYVSIKNQEENAITLAYDGSIGEAFYQPQPFLASEKIAVLRIHKKWGKTLTPAVAIFLITLIRQEKFRYNYGLKWSVNSRLLSSIIKLPVKLDGTPDWTYMENYINTLPFSSKVQ